MDENWPVTTGKVFCAVVQADEGPDTTVTTLLDAQWPTPESARAHVERRYPQLREQRQYEGLRMRAYMVPAIVQVPWVYDDRGKIVPRDLSQKLWCDREVAELQSDGKVTW